MAPSCCVCQDKLVLHENTYAAKCGHVLHFACWSNWLERSANCPQCRKTTQKEDLIRLYFNTGEDSLVESANSNDVNTLWTDQVDLVAAIEKLMMEITRGKAYQESRIDLLRNYICSVQSDFPTMRSHLRQRIEFLTLRVAALSQYTTLHQSGHHPEVESWKFRMEDLNSKLSGLRHLHMCQLRTFKYELKALVKSVSDLRGNFETEFESLLREARDFKENASSPSPSVLPVKAVVGALEYLKLKHHSLIQKYEVQIRINKTGIRELEESIYFARDCQVRSIDSVLKELRDHKQEILSVRNDNNERPCTSENSSAGKNRSVGISAGGESSVTAVDEVIILSDSDE